MFLVPGATPWLPTVTREGPALQATEPAKDLSRAWPLTQGTKTEAVSGSGIGTRPGESAQEKLSSLPLWSHSRAEFSFANACQVSLWTRQKVLEKQNNI